MWNRVMCVDRRKAEQAKEKKKERKNLKML